MLRAAREEHGHAHGAHRLPLGHRRSGQQHRLHARAVADPAGRNSRHRARRRRRRGTRRSTSCIPITIRGTLEWGGPVRRRFEPDSRHDICDASRRWCWRPASVRDAREAEQRHRRKRNKTGRASGVRGSADRGRDARARSESDDADSPTTRKAGRDTGAIEGVSAATGPAGPDHARDGARAERKARHASSTARSALDATIVRVVRESFIATIQQRGLAFDGNWFANNALGVRDDARHRSDAQPVPLLSCRRSRRSAAPPSGSTTADLQLQASAGEPGLYRRIAPARASDRLGGSLATAGAQWAFAPRWQAGVQLTDVHDVQSPYAQNASGRINAQAAYASLAWNGATTRLQGNVLASDVSDSSASVNAVGVWLDGSTTLDRYTHHYGVYRLEPGLTWGYQPIDNDIEGVYYRIAYQSLRWQMDAGIDQVDSVSGLGINGTYLTLNGRYQATLGLGFGGNGDGCTTGRRILGRHRRLPITLGPWARAASASMPAVNHSTLDSDAEQIGIDHTWIMPAGTRLSTSLAATRDTSQAAIPGITNDTSLRRFGVGVLGGGDLTDRLSLDVNLQYNILQRRRDRDRCLRQRRAQLALRHALVGRRDVLRQSRRFGEAVPARSADTGDQSRAGPAQSRVLSDRSLRGPRGYSGVAAGVDGRAAPPVRFTATCSSTPTTVEVAMPASRGRERDRAPRPTVLRPYRRGGPFRISVRRRRRAHGRGPPRQPATSLGRRWRQTRDHRQRARVCAARDPGAALALTVFKCARDGCAALRERASARASRARGGAGRAPAR